MGDGPVIAVDGPAGAGKSTLARHLAQALHYRYLDTGAMYRAVTWAVLARGVSPRSASDHQLGEIARQVELQVNPDSSQVWVDQTEVTVAIRQPRVSQMVSWVARAPQVREQLVVQQRQWAAGGYVVVDGRDIGTVVFPDAPLKFFLTAAASERARRRWQELQEQGYQVGVDQLQRDVEERDRMDSRREAAPLRVAADAVVLDSTGRTAAEVLTLALQECERRGICPCTGCSAPWSGSF